ncbi:hypothetical protein M407DRAFT_83585 [Tulasnella calospora MUT 4182]|uniref:VWFA domain-containing protein n=1 Tax=Tulasnella calospora MUT 4182 TaxID=1051891 RepID=A0A0C3PV30_9AGAM|nr:hypothetical protein M407DRAFT_83585 [Tulasnella calospora MUT 4182]
MRNTDRLPLPHQPVASRIESRHNNRFGAVLSALYQFLQERYSSNGGDERRDAYSILVFNQLTEINVQNDMDSSIDQLMENALQASPSWGTNFSDALHSTEQVMEASWSPDRAPVVVFLSDGEGHLDEDIMRGLCDRAVSLGSPLSFWSISFGPYSRVLRKMADIAKDVASRAPRGSNAVAVPSAFCTAINTVQLARTFSNIATSLRKARASLINPTAPAPGLSVAPREMLLI